MSKPKAPKPTAEQKEIERIQLRQMERLDAEEIERRRKLFLRRKAMRRSGRNLLLSSARGGFAESGRAPQSQGSSGGSGGSGGAGSIPTYSGTNTFSYMGQTFTIPTNISV